MAQGVVAGDDKVLGQGGSEKSGGDWLCLSLCFVEPGSRHPLIRVCPVLVEVFGYRSAQDVIQHVISHYKSGDDPTAEVEVYGCIGGQLCACHYLNEVPHDGPGTDGWK